MACYKDSFTSLPSAYKGISDVYPWLNWVKTQEKLEKSLLLLDLSKHKLHPYFPHSTELEKKSLRTKAMICITKLFFSSGATAPIWALAYLRETLRFTSVF
jgi:hypothetical protein